jgi:hypothetical protein
VVNKTGVTKVNQEKAVDAVFEIMKRSLDCGVRVELRGFGHFDVRARKHGIGRNPRTGQEFAVGWCAAKCGQVSGLVAVVCEKPEGKRLQALD